MENFPSNSHRTKPAHTEEVKPEEKKVTQVVTGEVTRRKKPLGKRLSETFIGGDATSVWSYVAFDVMIPAAKDMIADAFSQGVERMLFGDVRSPSRRGGGSRYGSPAGHVSYNRFSGSGTRREREETRPRMSPRARASHDFDEIILDTRAEAEEVLERMFDVMNQYQQVTVADLYDLVGVTGNYTDQNWGWQELRGAGVTKAGRGYLLDLPKPESLRD